MVENLDIGLDFGRAPAAFLELTFKEAY